MEIRFQRRNVEYLCHKIPTAEQNPVDVTVGVLVTITKPHLN
jgi:hypothetical protein